MLADGMEKKPKDVVVKIKCAKLSRNIAQVLVGLETDEDENVSLPPAIKG